MMEKHLAQSSHVKDKTKSTFFVKKNNVYERLLREFQQNPRLKAEEALVVHALCRNLLEHKTNLISFGWQFIGYCITLTFGAREDKSL